MISTWIINIGNAVQKKLFAIVILIISASVNYREFPNDFEGIWEEDEAWEASGDDGATMRWVSSLIHFICVY